MAVEQQISKGQKKPFSFIIAPVDMKQIFIIDEKNRRKNATSAVKGKEVQSILSTELAQGVTIKAVDGGMQNKDVKEQDDRDI